MIWWLIFIIRSALSMVAAVQFIPYQHRLNYAQCRKPWEYYLSAWLFNAIWIVSAIQSYSTPAIFSAWMRIAGLVYLCVGDALVIWSWRVNDLFVPAIIYVPPELRVKDGPYRFCNHPGYFGFILAAIGMTWLLGQWWALYPACAYVTLIIRRMIVEDRVLSKQHSL